MADAGRTGRTDRAARWILSTPETIYRALIDPEAIVAWRPPRGMTARMDVFEAREGGRFRMVSIYNAGDGPAHGKTSENIDVVEGRFAELVANARVVEVVTFCSDDPAFAGEMTVTTTLTPRDGGTEVAIRCDNVPAGIGAADHVAGLTSTLENLAAFTT